MIYLDNAASSYPKPASVSKAVYFWLKNNGANPGRSGHKMSIEASELIYNTRCDIAKLFGISDPENIAFVPNTTVGLNIIIQGAVKSGDHIIITDLEHNSVIRPVYKLSEKGLSYDIAETDLYDDGKTIQNILKLIKKNTKLVVCTQCSNVCGKIMPIVELSKALPENVLFAVDGAQGAGVIPIDLKISKIDYYCAPSHKGLLGPQGAGFVALQTKLHDSLLVGGTGSESFNRKQPDYMPDFLESGTLPTPVIAGMKSGLEYISKIGIDSIYQHKKMLTDYFYSEAANVKNIINYVDNKKGSFVSTCCFNIKNTHSEEIGQYLNENGIYVRSGFHCSPLFHKKMNTEKTGMVRVSFGDFNTKSDINKLIFALNKYKKI